MTDVQRIDELSDEQAFAILEALTGEVADEETPEGVRQQILALAAIFDAEGQRVDVDAATRAAEPTAAEAARQVLTLMAKLPQTAPSVDEWLDEPPTQEAAAVPLVLAAPLVLTACVVLLQIAGHTKFHRHTDGQWSVSYDPAARTPLDGTVREMVRVLAKLMSSMAPGPP